MNPLLLPPPFDQPPNQLPGLPPLIHLPILQPRPVMAAGMIPPLQPGAGMVGNITGQFPQIPEVPYTPPAPAPSLGGQLPIAGDLTNAEVPESGYRELAGGTDAGDAAPSGPSAPSGGGIGRFFNQNMLGALGLGLVGLGGPQGRSPVLEDLVSRSIQQRQQAQALGPALSIMSAAGQAPNATEAQRIYDAALQRPEVRQNVEVTKMLLAERHKVAVQAYSENTELRAQRALEGLPENYTQEDALAALQQKAVPISEQTRKNIETRPKRYTDDKTGSGQPIRVDWKEGRVQKAGARGDWIKLENNNGVMQFYDPDTGRMQIVGGAVKTSPGDRIDVVGPGGEANAGRGGVPIVDRPERQPISEPVARELTGLGFSFAQIQSALEKPESREAALGVLQEATQRAKVSEGAPKPTFQDWATYRAANPSATYRQFLDKFAPTGLPTQGGATEETNFEKRTQQNRVDVAKAGAETTSGLTEQRAINTEARKRDQSLAVARTALNQAESLIPALAASGHLAADSSGQALLKAKAIRSQIPIVGQPGDPNWAAWQSLSGMMVSIERSMGDIGPRAMAAYKGLMNVIENPTTPEASRLAFKQVRQQIEALESGQEQGAAPAPTPAAPAATGRLRIQGPNGERGTVPAGTDLSRYPGWKAAP